MKFVVNHMLGCTSRPMRLLLQCVSLKQPGCTIIYVLLLSISLILYTDRGGENLLRGEIDSRFYARYHQHTTTRQNKMIEIPKSHPRYESLMRRDKLVAGIEAGITSMHGLIAHGRGEAFDYLIGERTMDSALKATEVAAAILSTAKKPVLSVNGNVAALASAEIVTLSRLIDAPLEVNIFYRTEARVKRIKKLLEEQGAKQVLGDMPDARLDGIEHARGLVAHDGIYTADVVLAPLEDGDRCEALIAMGKKVITIDLNPLSRTSRYATVSIVDDVQRALRNIIKIIEGKNFDRNANPDSILEDYDNSKTLKAAINEIAERLLNLSISQLHNDNE